MASKWTPARRRKFRATMKAKRAAGYTKTTRRMKDVNPAEDAIAFLEMAEKAILKQAGEGRKKRFTPSDTYAMLALATLRGEV